MNFTDHEQFYLATIMGSESKFVNMMLKRNSEGNDVKISIIMKESEISVTIDAEEFMNMRQDSKSGEESSRD